MPPRQPTPRNQAFISFAREDNADAGRRWADWLAQVLESFEVPEDLAGRPTPAGPVPARLSPVGRSHPAEEQLAAAQRAALVESRTLTVICSPAAAKSARVAEEVRLFKQFSQGRVLALIVAGEPETDQLPGAVGPAKNECFPETLRFEVRPDGTVDREWRVRPVVVVDLRLDGDAGFTAQGTYLAVLNAAKKADENLALAEAYGARLEDARRTLLAGVLGVPPAELDLTPAGARPGPRPPAARARRGVPFSTAIIFLLLLGCGGLGWLAYHTLEQNVTLEATRERADRTIVAIQRELHTKLAPGGHFALAMGANDQIVRYLNSLARDSQDPLLLGALADALGNAADVQFSVDNLSDAYQTALEAVRIRQQAAALPNVPAENGVRQIADLRRVAQISQKVGKVGDALSIIQQSMELAARLGRERLNDSDIAREMIRSQYAAGAMLTEGGKPEEGTRTVMLGRDLAKKELAAQLEAEQGRLTMLAGETGKPPATARPDPVLEDEVIRGSELLGELHQKAANYPGAMNEYREVLRAIKAMIERDPKDPALQSRFAKIQMQIGNLLALEQRFDDAAAEFRPAVEAAERAAREQPTKLEAQFDYVLALRRLAEILVNSHLKNRSEGLLFYNRAIEFLDFRFPNETTGRAAVLKKELQALRDEALK